GAWRLPGHRHSPPVYRSSGNLGRAPAHRPVRIEVGGLTPGLRSLLCLPPCLPSSFSWLSPPPLFSSDRSSTSAAHRRGSLKNASSTSRRPRSAPPTTNSPSCATSN